MDTSQIRAIIEAAAEKKREADAARDALSALLLTTMRGLLPAGTVINLTQRPRPEYLAQVRTMAGNDRGTNTFRVTEVVMVSANPEHPAASKWVCEAVPVSEKTGKDMSASTHAATRVTVRLTGDVGYALLEDDVSAPLERLINLVAQQAKQPSECAAAAQAIEEPARAAA